MATLTKGISSRSGVAKRAKEFEQKFFAPDNTKSKLAEVLLKAWIWGKISTPLVQQIADAASRDIEAAGYGKLNEWQVLAQLGTRGKHINNVRRDLERKLPSPMFQLHDLRMPIRVALKGQEALVRNNVAIPFLLPETTWRRLWGTNAWESMILGNPKDVPVFWDSPVAQHPSLLHHPVKRIPGYKDRAIPLCLHGDGAAVTQCIGSGSKSCLFISFWSMLDKSTAAKEKHILVAAIWCHMCSKVGLVTSRSVWRAISDSFTAMMEEKGASTGGYFGVPIFSTGDLEYFNAWQQLPRWNSANPCGLCEVQQAMVRNFKQCPVQEAPVDLWHTPRQAPCPLYRSVMSPSSVCPDLMHSKHLGVDQRFLGSVCYVIITEIITHVPKFEDRLAILLRELKSFWTKNKMDAGLHNLTIGMVLNPSDLKVKKSFPRLKAKAWETKQSISALLTVWKDRMNSECQHHKWIKIALENSLLMEDLVAGWKNEWALDLEHRNKLCQACLNYFTCNLALFRHYSAKGMKLFQSGTFKHHWLDHSCKLSHRINPLHVSCYSGESFMSEMKTLMASNLRSRNSLSSIRRFMLRYIQALTFEVTVSSKSWKLR